MVVVRGLHAAASGEWRAAEGSGNRGQATKHPRVRWSTRTVPAEFVLYDWS
jgi:hypothetical protein